MINVLAIFFALSLNAHAQAVNPVLSQSVNGNPVVNQLVELANAKKLSETEEWRRIVHYRRRLFGSWTSEASGMNFFVSSYGRSNPRDELEETLAGFFDVRKRKLDDGQPAQSVRCQFPLRYKFLNRELGLDKFVPAQDCPELDEFRGHVAAKSVTLVFSSFYASNPSSTYGHSLMRLNKADGSSGSEHAQLLDNGVNYAAAQTTSNPILYTVYGLFGFFHGVFTKVPYFYKVREYGDFESRDLWEYDLSLTPLEVSNLVDHLWELGSTYFDYYYLTKNCSYHMLTLIEAAAPRTHLVSRVPFWVIPTDTIKAVFNDGLVRKTNFRASLDSQFKQRLSGLSQSEEMELRRLVSLDRRAGFPTKELPSESFSPDERAHIDDAYMDYVDLHYAEKLYKKEADFAEPKSALLRARARLPMTKPLDFSTPPVASPNESHGSARASVSRLENQNFGGATDFSIRFALHDLADPTRGLPEYADIDFFHLDLRLWDSPSRLRVEHGVIFGVGSFAPLDPYTHKMSFRAKIGFDRVEDARCSNCLAGGIYGGAGYSMDFGKALLFYGLADGELFTSPDFVESKFSARLGPTLGLRLRFSDALALVTELNYAWAFTKPQYDDYKIESHLRLVPGGSTWGLDLHGQWRTENREVAVGVLHYF